MNYTIKSLPNKQIVVTDEADIPQSLIIPDTEYNRRIAEELIRQLECEGC